MEEEESMPEECVQKLKAKERGLLHSLVVVEPTTRIGQLIQREVHTVQQLEEAVESLHRS